MSHRFVAIPINIFSKYFSYLNKNLIIRLLLMYAHCPTIKRTMYARFLKSCGIDNFYTSFTKYLNYFQFVTMF